MWLGYWQPLFDWRSSLRLNQRSSLSTISPLVRYTVECSTSFSLLRRGYRVGVYSIRSTTNRGTVATKPRQPPSLICILLYL